MVFLLQQIQEGKFVYILKYFPNMGKQLKDQMQRIYITHKRLLEVSYSTIKDIREIIFFIVSKLNTYRLSFDLHWQKIKLIADFSRHYKFRSFKKQLEIVFG